MSSRSIADVSTFGAAKPAQSSAGGRAVPALTIVSHPRAQRAGERCLLEQLGRELSLSRNTPSFAGAGSVLGTPLDDPFLSRRPLKFVWQGPERMQVLVEAGGTEVVVGAPVRGGIELGMDALAAGVPIELAGRIVLLLHLASTGEEPPADSLGMLGRSAGVRRVREHILRIADLSVPVLICGETGTGKELVARAIHERSPRRSGPFVSVNLGAVPKDLAAAELFGAHKGAYTGATRDRDGFFRAARGGTLFLDEVGEAPPEVQVMLLRVLETGEMYPVGGQTPIATDVRLLAATDANLEEQIRVGSFKAPLLHRLAGYVVQIPPLRERREDIGLLFARFAHEELAAIGEEHRLSPQDPYAAPWLPAKVAAHLVRYAWPGNIRQLRNVTRQLVIGSRGQPQIQLDSRLEKELSAAATLLPEQSPSAAVMQEPEREARGAPRRRTAEVTEPELLAALRAKDWDLKAAADQLGIPRSSMYDLIDRSPNIRTAGDVSAQEITQCFNECSGDLDAMVRRLEVSRRALVRRIKELGLER